MAIRIAGLALGRSGTTSDPRKALSELSAFSGRSGGGPAWQGVGLLSRPSRGKHPMSDEDSGVQIPPFALPFLARFCFRYFNQREIAPNPFLSQLQLRNLIHHNWLEDRINGHACGADQANGHDCGPPLHERVDENAALPAPLGGHAGDEDRVRGCAYGSSLHGDANDHASR
jgi:hypothetical protein